EQGYGVREARGEPAQAGQQQQFFDLSGHDVLPRRGSGESKRRNVGAPPRWAGLRKSPEGGGAEGPGPHTAPLTRSGVLGSQDGSCTNTRREGRREYLEPQTPVIGCGARPNPPQPRASPGPPAARVALLVVQKFGQELVRNLRFQQPFAVL